MPTAATPDTPDPDHHVDQLLDMDDDDFYQLVQDDRRALRHPDTPLPPLLRALRHDDVLDRWLDTATRTHADITLAIGQANAGVERARAVHDQLAAGRLLRSHARLVRALKAAEEQRREIKELVADRNRREDAHRVETARLARAERRRRHRDDAHERAYERALRTLRDAHPGEFARHLADAVRIETDAAPPTA